jgi:hypothetical protein
MGQQYLMEYVSKFYMNHTYAICNVCMMVFFILKTWDVTVVVAAPEGQLKGVAEQPRP